MVKRIARHPRATVMIFADASWCSQTRAGGWGVWLKTDLLDRAIVKGGPIKVDVPTPNVAELVAIANGLFVAKRLHLLRPLDVVMIQSDCAEALAWIRGRVPTTADNRAVNGLSIDVAHGKLKTRKRVAAPLQVIAEIAEEFSLRLQVRHVRGHQDGDGRQYVNRLCDQIAKAGMRRRRDQLAAQCLPLPERKDSP